MAAARLGATLAAVGATGAAVPITRADWSCSLGTLAAARATDCPFENALRGTAVTASATPRFTYLILVTFVTFVILVIRVTLVTLIRRRYARSVE